MGGIISGGTYRQATAHETELYERMRQQQAQQSVPLLHRRDHSHEYLFVALFDGTGQDVNDPKQLPTNIGVLKVQLDDLENEPGLRVGGHYVPGIGTQKNPITRLIDGVVPYTWDDRIMAMYKELATQVSKWRDQDPQAQVRLVEIGYSRGAVLVPGLARLVDQYGIIDPDSLKVGRDAHGNLALESPRTLIPPGQIAQAVGLFDPVATNMPDNYDARLPPSVLSGFSLMARDEQREWFPHQTIIAPQVSHDRRFVSVPVPGGHSNVGGGNREAGLESLAFNGMADYLNALSDRPLFEHRPLPADPAQYQIYQARGATAALGATLDHDGQRDLREELANCKIVDPCRDSEPMDLALARQFPWREVQPVAIERPPVLPDAVSAKTQPMTPEQGPAAAKAPISAERAHADALISQYLAALAADDREGMRAASIAFVDSDYGQRLRAESQQRIAQHQQQLPGRDNPLFVQATQHLERLGPEVARYSDSADMERIAGALAHDAQRHHMRGIDEITVTRNGELMATWTDPRNSVLRHQATIDPFLAGTRPLEQSFQQVTQETQRQEQLEMAREQDRQMNMHHGRSL